MKFIIDLGGYPLKKLLCISLLGCGLSVNAQESDALGKKIPIHNSVAVINVSSRTGDSAGSGFITEMDGKKYLITNQHVIDCMERIDVRTSSGTRIIPTSFEVCTSIDLVRMEITNDIPPLILSRNPPNMDDAVSVYGNSDGSGVITKTDGKILGIGPNRIEVDAEFIQGNSGCPILNSSNEVVGVATYALLHDDPEEWVSKGTRYREIRRFGLTLDHLRWTDMPAGLFSKQSAYLSDASYSALTYAITYCSFRMYLSRKHEPRKPSPTRQVPKTRRYRDSYGQWQTETYYVTEPNPNYDAELATWETAHKEWLEYEKERESRQALFRLGCPNQFPFFDKETQEKCINHYRTASDVYRSVSPHRAHKGRIGINLDAIDRLEDIKKDMESQRFSSKYLRDKAAEIVSLCQYVLDFHGKL